MNEVQKSDTFNHHLLSTRVRKTAKSDYQPRQVCPSVRPSVSPQGATSTKRTFMTMDI
jgi:hypothetical protein